MKYLLILILGANLFGNSLCRNNIKDAKDMIYTYYNELDDASDKQFLAFVYTEKQLLKKVLGSCGVSDKDRKHFEKELKELP